MCQVLLAITCVESGVSGPLPRVCWDFLLLALGMGGRVGEVRIVALRDYTKLTAGIYLLWDLVGNHYAGRRSSYCKHERHRRDHRCGTRPGFPAASSGTAG